MRDSRIVRSPAAPETGSSDSLTRQFNISALVAAAAMIGLSLILAIAANWDGIGKSGRFGLVGAVLAISALGALAFERLRVPLSLVGVVAIGGLLALFGQTYQTGADPWQLFALWAGLSLPWVTASRHDATWSLWVIIFFAALPLWVHAMAGHQWYAQPAAILPVWLLAAIVSAALSPWSGFATYTGVTNWAFRLAVVLTAALVVTGALPAIMDKAGSSVVVFGGFFLLAAAVAAFVNLKPFELGLLAVCTLAIDVLIIAAIVYLMFFRSQNSFETASFLVMGIISAIVVAVSGAAVLGAARTHGIATLTGDDLPNGSPERHNQSSRTWPIIIMTSIGALLAAIPFIAFFALMFGTFLSKGPGPFLFGGLILAATIPTLRTAPALGFGQQFGVIALVLGMTLVGFGLFRDLSSPGASLIMMLGAAGLAYLLPLGWIAGLLGAISAAFATQVIQQLSGTPSYGLWLLSHSMMWSSIAVIGAMALIGQYLRPELFGDAKQSVTWSRFLSGWIVAALLGTISAEGNTLLLGVSLWGSPGANTGMNWAPLLWHWNWLRLLSVMSAAGAAYWVLQHWPGLRTLTGWIVAVIAILLSAVMPSLGGGLLVLAASLTAARRALTYFSAFTVMWVMGAFYYSLGWPLLDKAYLMLGLGLALGAVAWFSDWKFSSFPGTSLPTPSTGRAMAAGLISLSTLTTAGTLGHGIWDKENIIQTGRTIFLELAPVDPRSLVQGDYMALRFALPALPNPPSTQGGPINGPPLSAIATVDERRVASVKSFVTGAPNLGPGEILIATRAKNGAWIIGTDAWFFKEGTAKKYEAARFGEFRIRDDGAAILVGLTNADLQALR